ncbi:MAG: carboxypeptidase M32 [Chlamydiota bacterium]
MTKDAIQDYNKLIEITRKTSILKGVSSLLGWDQETQMPQGSAPIRAEQMERMAEIIHKEKTSKQFVKALEKLIDIQSGEIQVKNLKVNQKAALAKFRRDYIQAIALPKRFVSTFARVTCEAKNTWREAREDDDFSKFAPSLKRIIDLNKEKAEYLGYTDHPYDALLDQFEPEMSTKEVDKVFKAIKSPITKLLKKILEAKQVNDNFLHGKFSEKKQLEFGNILLNDMGFDNQFGRMDLSTHPFCSSSHPTDCRVTTRIHQTGLMGSLMAALHEGGHSLYEMGLPQEHYGSPLCEAVSLGIHESQSRWWETRIGMSKPYWKHYLPLLKKTFKGKFDRVSLDKFYVAINKVEPSFIRVEADEVTYPLHVILRFELEKSLIEGSLKVEDLPDAWNTLMEKMIGITPENYKEGCLQDIHWSMGAFGYFPTYALGNLYCAQLFNAFESQHPKWEKQVAQGKLEFIKDWLNKQVYQYGRQYNSRDLIKKATGKKFSEKPYINYLTEKYSAVYKL